MGKKICANCEQIIGNLEKSFFHKSQVVCKACKILLNDESLPIGIIDSKTESEIPIAETLPQDGADTENKPVADLVQQNEQKKNYGGIHRTGYLLGILAIVVVKVLSMTAAKSEHSEPGASFGLVVMLMFSFFLVINRLKNIGMSGWWSVLILVPLANLFIVVKCAICPEGYQNTKKLDTAGKIIAGIFIGLIVLVVISVVIGALIS